MMFLIVAFQEFAGVVVWRIAFEFPTYLKHEATGDHDKPLELAVYYVYRPTALMVSSILAMIVAFFLIIDVCRMSETTGKNNVKPGLFVATQNFDVKNIIYQYWLYMNMN